MKSPIAIKHKGSFRKTEKFMKRTLRHNYMSILQRYGQQGVEILQSVTPKDTGETAASWYYEIYNDGKAVHLSWFNSNENNGVSVVILLLYGHGLQNGGYVPGNDFVTPAIQPLLDDLARKAWREVTK
jgi:hypothetical protein